MNEPIVFWDGRDRSHSWDRGVRWSSHLTVPPTNLPIDVDTVAERVLRVMNYGADDDFVELAIIAATKQAEHDTQRALMPQTWEMVFDRFPCSGQIRVERPPFIEVLSLSYYDSNNEAQELAVSPALFNVVPSGAYSKAVITPVAGTVFPATYCRPDAVTLSYRAGYEDSQDYELKTISMGIALVVGELYKLRSLSVQAIHNTPSVLQTSRFWRRVW